MHGTASTTPVQAYLVVYGIKDWSDNVDPAVYDSDFNDQMFEYKHGNMVINTDIDMKNHKLTNLPRPILAGDAVNKISLDSLSFNIKNHYLRTVFNPNFYDLVETSQFNLVRGVSGVVINGVQPDLILETDRFITNYSQEP